MLQELSKAIENMARSVIDEVHTALPGEIVSYDATKSTVSVKPIGKFITSDNKSLDYPVISEVPVMFPYSTSNELGIAFPVKKGEYCLIIVSEVELDKWRSGADSEAFLRFDLTNAVVIPGLLQKGTPLLEKAKNDNAIVIGSKDVQVLVSKEEVKINVGDIEFIVSKSGISARGDFSVDGNISYTGSISGA